MPRVMLLLGSGSNLGQAIASKFAASGYRVALAARSLTDGQSKEGYLHIRADFSRPSDVTRVFQETTESLGTPNVVIYNLAKAVRAPAEDPLAASLADFEDARIIGFDSAFVAAQEALKGFKTLPSTEPTAYIYTGNALNQIAIAGLFPFGTGKVLGATLIEYAAGAYGKKGYRFYYADERMADGKPVGNAIDGPAHADMYLELAEEASQSPWSVTFVKGQGRKPFGGIGFDGKTRDG